MATRGRSRRIRPLRVTAASVSLRARLLYAYLDECRPGCSECHRECRIKLSAAADAHGLNALRTRQRTEIQVRQTRSRRIRYTEVRRELVEGAIATVVDDHEGNGQCELCGAPQSLDRVHRRAITE